MIIFHLISKADWDAQPAGQPLRVKSLDSEGFIHCSKGEKTMLQVANSFYKDLPGEFYLLHIDEDKLTSPVKWEAPAHPTPAPATAPTEPPPSASETPIAPPPEAVAEHGDAPATDTAVTPAASPAPEPVLFPHIYGPINREAIIGMRRMVRAEDGAFTGFQQIDDADPNNPLNLKTASQMADELLQATDEFSESLKRFKDRVEGRMAEIDEKIKKL